LNLINVCRAFFTSIVGGYLHTKFEVFRMSE